MNLYLLLKTLHILSSTILFGTGLGSAYYALRAWRSGQLPVIAVTFRHLVTADWLFIATTAVFQPLSGLAMVHVAGWSLAQAGCCGAWASTCSPGSAGYRWCGCRSAYATWPRRPCARRGPSNRWRTAT